MPFGVCAVPPIVVFDFDLTLTHWDTADRFFRWLLKRDPWRLAVVVEVMPVLGPLMTFRRTRWVPVRFAVWVATFGRAEQVLSALVREHVETVFEGAEPVLVDAGFAQLRTHLDQGHQVVVATGCLEPLAREILRRAGCDDIPLIASTLTPFLGGMVSNHHCVGQRKIVMLAQRGFAPPWAVAYTDHRADLPLLRLSERWFLVSPKPACLRHIERELEVQAEVLSWR